MQEEDVGAVGGELHCATMKTLKKKIDTLQSIIHNTGWLCFKAGVTTEPNLTPLWTVSWHLFSHSPDKSSNLSPTYLSTLHHMTRQSYFPQCTTTTSRSSAHHSAECCCRMSFIFALCYRSFYFYFIFFLALILEELALLEYKKKNNFIKTVLILIYTWLSIHTI